MIPKFDIFHENLHAGYLVFDKYMLSMQDEFINGFVLAQNNTHKTYFFLFEGELQSSFQVSDNSNGTKIQQIHELEIPRDCFVSTFRTSLENVEYFSGFYSAKRVYRDITTDKINPDKLFSKLSADRFSGFIERNNGPAPPLKSYIYFNKGRLIGGLYLSNNDGGFENGMDLEQAGAALDNSSFSIFTLVPQIRNPGREREMILKCFTDIFRMLESKTTTGQFSTLWRKCASQLSHQHEILDPLIGKFQYKNGQIQLYEKTDIRPAAAGINELANSVAEKLGVNGTQIQTIKKNYYSILAAYEIRN